jgi:hypothetical protein
MNHMLVYYSFDINFNNILPSIPSSPKRSLSFMISDYISVDAFIISSKRATYSDNWQRRILLKVNLIEGTIIVKYTNN